MNTRTVAMVVLVRDHKVLLMRRSQHMKRRPGQWDLPGGAIDEGEDLRVAAIRETKEEAGITIDPHKLQPIFVDREKDNEGLTMWVFFAGKAPRKHIEISSEHTEYRWVSVDDAYAMMEHPSYKALFEHIRGNQVLTQLNLVSVLQQA